MNTPYTQKSRVSIASNHDYITNLPSNVKEKILSKLPIKEAVRTTILSKKWIDTWTSIPNLVLYERNSTESSLIKLVDMVLLVHQGPIEIFNLSSCHSCNGAISRWIFILSRNGIKNLKLRFRMHERCTIPFRLMSCNALECLDLSHCNINIPRCFQVFKLMRIIILTDINSSGMSIGNMVSSCPLLEHLVLHYFVHHCCLHILAPNLTSLSIIGDVHDMSLETPKLASASILLYNHNRAYQKESNIIRALGRLSNIQRLNICSGFSHYLAMGPIPEDLPHIFNHLTEIFVSLCFDQDDIAVALCLFRNAPHLGVIKIECFPAPRTDQIKVHASWEAKEAHHSSLFKGLKVVNIMPARFPNFFELSLQNIKSILEFAKFVLSTAPALVKLNIIGFEDAKMIFEMLEYFPKLSKQAEILFL